MQIPYTYLLGKITNSYLLLRELANFTSKLYIFNCSEL